MGRGEGSETGGRARRGQRSASITQRSEIRCLRSGEKLTSDLRLLTSIMDDLNDFSDLNGLNDLSNGLRTTDNG
jgi:hypothetical protein